MAGQATGVVYMGVVGPDYDIMSNRMCLQSLTLAGEKPDHCG